MGRKLAHLQQMETQMREEFRQKLLQVLEQVWRRRDLVRRPPATERGRTVNCQCQQGWRERGKDTRSRGTACGAEKRSDGLV